MNTKAEAAVKGIKDLGGEVSAWESRLLYLQNESSGLARKNDQIKKEIESALVLAQQELDKKRRESKQEIARCEEEKNKLEAEKAEFQGILSAFKKEKARLEADQAKVQDLTHQAEALRVKASNFILLVRNEAAKL